MGVTFEETGQLFVVDSEKHVVTSYLISETSVVEQSSFGTNGVCERSIAIDSKHRRVFVADSFRDSVDVWLDRPLFTCVVILSWRWPIVVYT